MENKTGFIASSFDIMHPGYTLMLKECRDNCELFSGRDYIKIQYGRDKRKILP